MIPVTVTNNGAVGEWYFADARLAALTAMKLKNGDPTACTAPGWFDGAAAALYALHPAH
jgi:hypothetical protein